MQIITTKRPRVAAYQMLRYVDGPKLMLTCTRRGLVRLYELYTRRVPGGVVEDFRPLVGLDAAEALDRAVAAGYDPIAMTAELQRRARAR